MYIECNNRYCVFGKWDIYIEFTNTTYSQYLKGKLNLPIVIFVQIWNTTPITPFLLYIYISTRIYLCYS